MKSIDDILVKAKPLCELVKGSWKKILSMGSKESEMELFRTHERTDGTLGEDSFIEKVELILNRKLMPQKTGPKK